jgi:hypothetical protein
MKTTVTTDHSKAEMVKKAKLQVLHIKPLLTK